MSLVLQSSGGGQITIQEPATASNFTQTLPAATGTVQVSGNQPAFYVYLSADQSLTNATFVKMAFDTKLFDTANAFNTSTNRFQPTVAGYYQINGGFYINAATTILSSLFKNNTEYSRGNQSANAGMQSTYVSSLVYLNGSTDYIELYGYQTIGTAQNAISPPFLTYMNGSLVRAA